MSVIYILIGCSLVLASSFLVAFLWASKNGQFEDDYTPSVRMLFDNERKIGDKRKLNQTSTPPLRKNHSNLKSN
ncbi:MAG: cbb3-type cytochrome oxidase assembly protein CcoS [Bacteroidota bacterium]